MNEKITLPGMAQLLAIRSGNSKTRSEEFIKEFFSLIASVLTNGDPVKIKDLGVFKTVTVEARKSVNVSTGEDVEIPAHRKVCFIPSKELAAIINEPFEMFETVEVSDEVANDLDETDADTLEDTADETIDKADSTIYSVTDNLQEIHTALHPEVSENSIEEVNDIVSETEETEEISDTAETDLIDDSLVYSMDPDSDSTSATNDEAIEEVATISEATPDSIDSADSVNSDNSDNSKDSKDSQLYERKEIVDDFEDSEDSDDPEEIEESDYTDVPDCYDNNGKRKARCNFWIGLLCGVAGLLLIEVILLLSLGYIRFGDDQPKVYPVIISETGITPIAEATGEPSVMDSIISQKPDTIATDEVPTPVSDQKVYDTITKTRYLTTMAKDHYGNFHLWPYIYEENKSFLGHPDRIKPGTKVVVPDLKKYGVDPKNPDDIAKAKKLGVEIYSRYN